MVQERRPDTVTPVLQMLKILNLCFSDGMGGAAVGAKRLHLAMKANGVGSRLLVVTKTTDDEDVIEMNRTRTIVHVRNKLNKLLVGMIGSGNPVLHSLGILPTGTHKIINAMDADMVQMHWINADTISISEIAKINKPVVWKLPDMWAFSGAEHYKLPDDPDRYIQGYTKENRPVHESGVDLNRFVWNHKRKQWADTDFSIVGPSQWIADSASKSVLLRGRRVRHILNPLDTDIYRPYRKDDVRSEFGLPTDKKLVMFGAMHATIDKRKGFHHLRAALGELGKYLNPEDVEFVVLGSSGPENEYMSGYRVHYLGIIRDEGQLVRAYNIADVVVLPSEMDNLPNIIKEATCCGIPCVGFDVGGMPDMIEHKKTGYLAQPYQAEDLAKGIAWVVENSSDEMGEQVREMAVSKHDPAIVVDQYLSYYEECR